MNEISKYYNSFSGTDTLAFMLLPDTPPITLGALTTISYSVYRDKKPVNAIGNINVKGFTRGTRVVAGTLVFTLINKHWVQDIVDNCPWLQNIRSLKADELPLFDIMIVSANEYGATSSMFIYGVDITDEAQVLSVEDLFTENQFSYVARDIDTFDSKMVGKKDVAFRSAKEVSGYNNWTVLTDPNKLSVVGTVGSGGLTPSDVNLTNIQKELQDQGFPINQINGIMDETTQAAIIAFQEYFDLPVTGRIDRTTEMKILYNNYYDTRPVLVADKKGAFVYKEASTASDIVLQLPYSTKIVVLSNEGEWFATTEGYIQADALKIEDPENPPLPDYVTASILPGTIHVAKDIGVQTEYAIAELLENFSLSITSPLADFVVIDVISYFADGATKRKKLTYPLLPEVNKVVGLQSLRSYFIFDETYEDVPQMAEIFVQIGNSISKWIIRYQ